MESIQQSLFVRFRSLAAAAIFLPLLLGACGKSAATAASNLSETNRTTMSDYEDIRAALADDDLRGTKKAAKKLADALKPNAPDAAPSPMFVAATSMADASALDKARQDFKTMSADAIHLTAGAKGYYVINCPMTPNGDWVQTSQTVSNPYLGKIMHDCGVVKK